jgi:hypothetical protein
MHPFPGYVDLSVIVCSGQHIRAYDYILALVKGPLYVLINKACLAIGKNPNPVSGFSAAPSSSSQTHLGFLFPTPASMADASGSRLNLGAPIEKRGRGRPHGSKNKASTDALVASSSALVKRHPSRPAGSKTKPKVPFAAPGPSAPSTNASSPPPRLFLFFCHQPAMP